MNKSVIDRRGFISLTGRLLGSAAFVGLIPAQSLASSSQQVFFELSQQLTAIKPLSKELSAVFYNDLKLRYGESLLDSLLNQFVYVKRLSPGNLTQAIDKEIINHDKYKLLSRELIKLWYSGISQTSTASQSERANAYVQSLQWQAMDVKPIGIPGGVTWHLPR